MLKTSTSGLSAPNRQLLFNFAAIGCQTTWRISPHLAGLTGRILPSLRCGNTTGSSWHESVVVLASSFKIQHLDLCNTQMTVNWQSNPSTSIYPLVNVYITMERSTTVHGKTHILSMATFNSKLLIITRGYVLWCYLYSPKSRKFDLKYSLKTISSSWIWRVLPFVCSHMSANFLGHG